MKTKISTEYIMEKGDPITWETYDPDAGEAGEYVDMDGKITHLGHHCSGCSPWIGASDSRNHTYTGYQDEFFWCTKKNRWMPVR